MQHWSLVQAASVDVCPQLPGADIQLGVVGTWASHLVPQEPWSQDQPPLQCAGTATGHRVSCALGGTHL